LKIFAPLILTIVFHELVHVAIAVKLGYKVKVGYGRIRFNPVMYVKVVSGIRKKHYIAIILSPLIILSLAAIGLALVIPNSLIKQALSVLFIMNTAGSSGDILLALSVMRISEDALVEDYGTMIVANKPIPSPYSERVSLIVKLLAILAVLTLIVLFKVKVIVVK